VSTSAQTLAGLLFGIVTALRAARLNLQDALKEDACGSDSAAATLALIQPEREQCAVSRNQA
jgi:hypothetical protein